MNQKKITTNPQVDGIQNPYSWRGIYVYEIPDQDHKGRLKIGEVKLSEPSAIEATFVTRIKQQTQTADIQFNLLHFELAVKEDGTIFTDHDVHEVLERSNYPRTSNTNNPKSEWFKINLETAKNAIKAVKEGKKAIGNKSRSGEVDNVEFRFRPNQLEFIKETVKKFKSGKKAILWNAKMRFGKTATAFGVVKNMEFIKVLIITHRPSVNVDWYNDFQKILGGTYCFASKDRGHDINSLISEEKKFAYFASLQDLRGSQVVVQDESSGSESLGIDKNKAIFDIQWDLLIIDEAHEGTESSLGITTIEKIKKNFTIRLSGTPFNIIHKHKDDEILTWDYVKEQIEKNNWERNYDGRPNPYQDLPALSFHVYDMKQFINVGDIPTSNLIDLRDGAFKFHEFFRLKIDEQGRETTSFVHEAMVKQFLDLLVDDTQPTKFPYATKIYQDYNRHSLWLLPNRVDIIAAMEKLLIEHPVFKHFKIINISGNEVDDEKGERDAKTRVTKAIAEFERTITLTGQRLTTGASIPEWTAVFMLSDTSSATTYLQTAFRCQTPCKSGDRFKTQAYVYDFAPDRTLKLIAQAMELSHQPGTINKAEQKDAMGEFLNFCPIIASNNGVLKPYDVDAMLAQLKKVIIDRVSRNGFADANLYNFKSLELDELALSEFDNLKNIVGQGKNQIPTDITINDVGMAPLEKQVSSRKRTKKELNDEQKASKKKIKEIQDKRRNAIKTLTAVSIRMPLLIYGANFETNEDLTLENFIKEVDEISWKEYMPEGLTKDDFRPFIKYYDEDVFKEAAHNIRSATLECDNLVPSERIRAITEIFKTFKNPDKETVLTPWAVVNKHLFNTFGGFNFGSNESHEKDIVEKIILNSKKQEENKWKEWIQNKDPKILEINSKEGLYGLLTAFNIYLQKLIEMKTRPVNENEYREIWNEVLEKNIFILCKSPMAVSIAKRTIAGYNEVKTNIIYIEDLVGKLRKPTYDDITEELSEKFGISEMKFTATVGNPPYQMQLGGTKNVDIWQNFVLFATTISDNVAVIHPGRWIIPKKNMKKVRDNLLESGLKKFDYYPDSTALFESVAIDGGVVMTTFQRDYKGEVEYSIDGKKFGIYKKDEQFIQNVAQREIFNIFSEYLKQGTIKDRIKGSIGSLASNDYGYKKEDHVGFLSNSDEGMKKPHRIWANPSVKEGSSNKGSRFQWNFIDEANIGTIPDEILKTRKIMLDKKGNAIRGRCGNIINNIPQIVGKDAIASGDVFFVLPNSDTDRDLQLIKSLFMTKTARFLLSLTQQDLYVRGFENIPDYTILSKHLKKNELFSDHYFYTKYNFSDVLKNHIEKSISKKEENADEKEDDDGNS